MNKLGDICVYTSRTFNKSPNESFTKDTNSIGDSIINAIKEFISNRFDDQSREIENLFKSEINTLSTGLTLKIDELNSRIDRIEKARSLPHKSANEVAIDRSENSQLSRLFSLSKESILSDSQSFKEYMQQNEVKNEHLGRIDELKKSFYDTEDLELNDPEELKKTASRFIEIKQGIPDAEGILNDNQLTQKVSINGIRENYYINKEMNSHRKIDGFQNALIEKPAFIETQVIAKEIFCNSSNIAIESDNNAKELKEKDVSEIARDNSEKTVFIRPKINRKSIFEKKTN